MTTPAITSTPMQGWGYDNDQMSNPGPLAGIEIKIFGTSGGLTPATNIGNQMAGIILLPKQTATGRYTTSFTHTLQKAWFFLQLVNMTNTGTYASDTTGLINSIWLDNISGNTVTIGYQVATAMAQDWACAYLMFGN
jgi:hypothetical protein